ncbi:MAG: M20/M25/M40 family metallo-hydrolase [Terracidiphilus sp.]
MTRSRFFISLAAIFLPYSAFAQTAATAATSAPALDAATNQALVKLGGQLMVAGKAYEYDRVLADEIGPRLTGSANYVKAADWATSEFTRLGLSNVHQEPWEIAATWEPETWASGKILSPHEQRLHLESDGWSPSAPPGGVRGKVYHLSAFTPEAVKAEAAGIKDAIVLMDMDTFKAAEPLLFGKAIETAALIAGEGARAVLLGYGGTDNVPTESGVGAGNGAIAPIPVGDLGTEDTLLLRRMLDQGPVEVEFTFTNRIREHVKVNNVVAEIPGSDPGAGWVLIGGHLDSWHLGTGAEDNGTGAAAVLAVAQAMKATGIRPRRTIRFVLFGGEEQGLLGSNSYVRAHLSELDNCAGVFITDTGSEPPLGWYVFGREDEKKALAPLKPLLDSLGAGDTTDEGRFTFDTDNGAFTMHGVPSFVLWTPVEKYFLLHHKPSDTFDKVNQRDLNLGAAVMGVTLLDVADQAEPLHHLNQTELDEQLKNIKQYDEYQDIVTHKLF